MCDWSLFGAFSPFHLLFGTFVHSDKLKKEGSPVDPVAVIIVGLIHWVLVTCFDNDVYLKGSLTGKILGVLSLLYYIALRRWVQICFRTFFETVHKEHFLLTVGQIIIVFIYYSEESIMIESFGNVYLLPQRHRGYF